MYGANDPTDHRFQDLDYRILVNGAISLFYRQDVLDDAVQWFNSHNYHVYRLDCTSWESEDDFHRDIARVLNLPDYYGANLDAFNDSLGDLELPEGGGIALVFVRYDIFAQRLPTLAQTVLDIIEINSRLFLLYSWAKMVALIQSDDPQIRFERVGARPVDWNPREWLNKDRGL